MFVSLHEKGKHELQSWSEKVLACGRDWVWLLSGNASWAFTTRTQILDLDGRNGAAERTWHSFIVWAKLHLSISPIPSFYTPQVNLLPLLLTRAAELLMYAMTLLVAPASCPLLVLCLMGQHPWSYLKVQEVFLELNLVLFICFPHSLYKSTIETAFFHPRRLFANHF